MNATANGEGSIVSPRPFQTSGLRPVTHSATRPHLVTSSPKTFLPSPALTLQKPPKHTQDHHTPLQQHTHNNSLPTTINPHANTHTALTFA
ncbi:hypothetical protein E2C01_028255 [Portunus trituberculatus]|uniref:Uncharacterized protein n=1 Tax=Portunus trituberculatus TaxID=210409 RepID=A0A5B7EKV9_PORTR|nr:hypothetical protein [Portunus trituberculatus]